MISHVTAACISSIAKSLKKPVKSHEKQNRCKFEELINQIDGTLMRKIGRVDHGWSMNGMNVKEYTPTTSVSASIADVIALNT